MLLCAESEKKIIHEYIFFYNISVTVITHLLILYSLEATYFQSVIFHVKKCKIPILWTRKGLTAIKLCDGRMCRNFVNLVLDTSFSFPLFPINGFIYSCAYWPGVINNWRNNTTEIRSGVHVDTIFVLIMTFEQIFSENVLHDVTEEL